MSQTTLLRRCKDMKHASLDKCHGGEGALDWTDVVSGKELEGRALKFFHHNILAPGVTIGVHEHNSEEYYYIIDGKGTMVLDGEEFEVGAGDITGVFAGGSHGLRNDSDADLRIVVIDVG